MDKQNRVDNLQTVNCDRNGLDRLLTLEEATEISINHQWDVGDECWCEVVEKGGWSIDTMYLCPITIAKGKVTEIEEKSNGRKIKAETYIKDTKYEVLDTIVTYTLKDGNVSRPHIFPSFEAAFQICESRRDTSEKLMQGELKVLMFSYEKDMKKVEFEQEAIEQLETKLKELEEIDLERFYDQPSGKPTTSVVGSTST